MIRVTFELIGSQPTGLAKDSENRCRTSSARNDLSQFLFLPPLWEIQLFFLCFDIEQGQNIRRI